VLTNQRFARSTALFITLITVALLLMTFDVRTQGEGVTGTLQDGVRTLFSPVQAAVNAVVRPVSDAIDATANLAGLRAENDRLRAELEEANRVIAETEAIRRENEVLREITQLPLPGDLLERSVVARVESGGSSNFDHSVILDKGAAEGIAVGQPVVNTRGLIGRVVDVTSGTATVTLITDPAHTVAVQLAESGLIGTAEGRGAGDLKFLAARPSNPIEEGTVVVTFPGRYPGGLVVGRIGKDAEPIAGAGIQSTVVPAVEFNRLDFVRVILFLPGPDEPVPDQPAGVTP
jgi:rod shape-determining protein MreC